MKMEKQSRNLTKIKKKIKENKNESKPKEEGNIIINNELDTKEKKVSSEIKSENNEKNLNNENDILLRLNNLENEM